MVIGQQAWPELTACRQSQAVASVTEVVTQSVDKSDFAAGTGLWSLLALAADTGDTLRLDAVVADGYEGAELTADLAVSVSDAVAPDT